MEENSTGGVSGTQVSSSTRAPTCVPCGPNCHLGLLVDNGSSFSKSMQPRLNNSCLPVHTNDAIRAGDSTTLLLREINVFRAFWGLVKGFRIRPLIYCDSRTVNHFRTFDCCCQAEKRSDACRGLLYSKFHTVSGLPAIVLVVSQSEVCFRRTGHFHPISNCSIH